MCSSSSFIFGRKHGNLNERTGRGPLYTAAEKGRAKIVSILLTLGHSPDRCDVYGITPLQIAAWHGHCKVVKRLAEHSINVNITDRVGHSALFKAVWQGCAECAEILIKHGANCNLQDKLGDTALMLEAGLGCVRLIPLLIKSGANTDMQNLRGDTALHIAVCDGNYEFCRVLLENGANPNVRNMDGSTPLFYAVCRKLGFGAIECVKMLIRANADLELRGRETNIERAVTPFELAAYIDHPLGMMLLLTANCHLTCMNLWIYRNSDLPEVFQNHPSLLVYIKGVMCQPRSLRHYSRLAIRKQVKSHSELLKLDLPVTLKDYLCYADLDLVSV